MGLDILLVDDEEEFADALAERLRLRGYNPHVANRGEQALRLIEEGVARVVILDLKMPGMDGAEVLRRLKKNHGGVQVIVLSGHGSEMDETYVRSLGAIEYLRKPADIGAILRALDKARRQLQEGVHAMLQ